VEAPSSYVIILAAVVLAPILADLLKKPRVPSVLFEILLGVLIGPQVLEWAEVTPFVDGLASVGLAFLMFMAGYEIDLDRLKGLPAKLAVGSWLISLALGLAVGVVLSVTGATVSSLLIGLVLTTTAFGTILPMLQDRGVLDTPFGPYILAAGAVGEFGPIIAITLTLSGGNPALEGLLLVGFVLVALGAAYVATRPQPPVVVEALRRHSRTSAQLPVRVVMLLLGALFLLAYELGLDTLLGAFAAGMVLRVAFSEEQDEWAQPRLVAIGFGVLIPVFFVVSGMNIDVEALADWSELIRVPAFFLLFLVVRGLPALFVYRKVLPPSQRRALAFAQSTALPLVVVITQIGLDTGHMKPANAAALVGAAMLSVLVFPLVGFAQLEAAGVVSDTGSSEPDPEPRGPRDARPPTDEG
jgi:Kef-type K+ transport system membrane component KefB